MDHNYIKNLRCEIRKLERELFLQNKISCCDGVTLAQCHTLLEISENNKMNISELSTNLALDKSTISRTVDGLVNIGLVDREIPKENRRIATVQLSVQGEKTCERINLNNNKYFDKVLKDFTEDEKNTFLKLLQKLTKNMEAI